jgi:hypothetical protein
VCEALNRGGFRHLSDVFAPQTAFSALERRKFPPTRVPVIEKKPEKLINALQNGQKLPKNTKKRDFDGKKH